MNTGLRVGLCRNIFYVQETIQPRMRSILDSPERMREVDESDMLAQIESFPEDLWQSLRSSVDYSEKPDSVCICGMGGSAIGGEIIARYLESESETPISVVRGGDFPRWVDDRTLIMVISYSGNTDESLRMFRKAVRQGWEVIGITSGGVLLQLCQEYDSKCVVVPKGYQPRAALGHLMGALASVIEEAKIANIASELERLISPLKDQVDELRIEIPSDQNVAKKIAMQLSGKVPVIYSTPMLSGATSRWQTQLNENAKMMAFCGIFPECNHNHLVAWVEGGQRDNFIPVFIKGTRDSSNDLGIMDKTIDYLSESGIDPVIIWAKGRSEMHNVLSAIIMGDFVSYYLAMMKEVDPLPVKCIQELKSRL